MCLNTLLRKKKMKNDFMSRFLFHTFGTRIVSKEVIIFMASTPRAVYRSFLDLLIFMNESERALGGAL